MRQSKKEFYPKGVDKGKRAILFNIQITNTKEYNSMTLSEKILALAFLEDCKNTVQIFFDEINEMKNPAANWVYKQCSTIKHK